MPDALPALDVDAVTHNYLIAAVWTANAWFPPTHPAQPHNPAPLDDLIDVHDLSAEVVAAAADDVRTFLASIPADDLAAYLAHHGHWEDDAAAQLGHDLSLTRNGHGAGFWDRGLGDLGDRLTVLAHAMGEADLDAYLTATCEPDDLTSDDLDGPVTWGC